MHTIKKTYGEWECDCGFSGETVEIVLAHVDKVRIEEKVTEETKDV